MSLEIPREKYASFYGPTTGDRIRLADTELLIEIERDYAIYGDEAKFGGGKTIRDGMGQSPLTTSSGGALDTVITNAVILDWWGIIKADIGIKDGRIAGIGKAGNPHLQAGVDANLIIGAGTEVIAGENLIVTAGGIDTHVHFVSAQQCEYAIASGITTMLGGGTGPAAGTNATTCTPGPFNLQRMYQSAEAFPVNLGFFGKGNCSSPGPLAEQVESGACGLKMHEDWGSTPAVIDACLKICDEYDVQAATIRAINGRVVHAFHTEGAGGGHAPDIIKIAGEPNVLPSSTNPTRPFTVNTIDEHLDMLIVCHHLNKDVPEDISFAESRIRPQTIAAEDVLHDLGVISMFSSDSQAMGRIGEVIIRCWQTADKMKRQFGRLDSDNDRNDNNRVKRYVAKYTINPAITHGIASYVGSIEKGKWADLVLWQPAFFGVKPEMVIKGGFIAYAQMGDPNASIPTPQPVFPRPMFASFGSATYSTSLLFMSRHAVEHAVPAKLGLRKQVLAVSDCRSITKRDMKLNDSTPNIEVNPETYQVFVNGKLATCDPARELPLAQRYFLF